VIKKSVADRKFRDKNWAKTILRGLNTKQEYRIVRRLDSAFAGKSIIQSMN
jgi:hypothetical protein